MCFLMYPTEFLTQVGMFSMIYNKSVWADLGYVYDCSEVFCLFKLLSYKYIIGYSILKEPVSEKLSG